MQYKVYIDITEASGQLTSACMTRKQKKKKKCNVVFSKTTIKSALINTFANKKKLWRKVTFIYAAKGLARTSSLETEGSSLQE